MRYQATAFLLAAWALIGPASALAGGGPQNVLVVVNEASPQSMALGNYYRETRGIPAFNVFAINVTTNYNIDTAAFSNQVRNPILTYIAEAGLSNQIEYIVFTRDIPYRVYDGIFTNMRFSSITASMFYDFKSSPDAFPPPQGGNCEVAVGSDHGYFASERAFRRAIEGNHFLYPSTYLTALTMDQSLRMVDRSILADHSRPTGQVYVVHTTDIFRNIRWPQYEEARYLLRFLDPILATFFPESPLAETPTNTMGFTTGATLVNGIAGFDFQPGSLAEHLTSYGGNLFDTNQGKGDGGQMSILHWIAAGAAGSYGTVVEPCAFTNKFPQIRLYYWYARGFNLAESFYMAVRNPYQGIVVGDPLTQPYARPPMVSIDGIDPGTVVSGTTSLTVVAESAFPGQTVDRIDLYLNDRMITTLTNVGPRSSNTVTATINGSNRTVTVQNGDTLYDVAQKLADEINPPPPGLGVTATASGDRVEIRQNALDESGTGITYSVSTSIGSATELTVFGTTPGTNFVESTASALRAVRLNQNSPYGAPKSGDVVRVTITRLDDMVFTNEVTASTNSTALGLMTNLMMAVNNDTNLTGTGGVEMKLLSFIPNASQAEAVFTARTNSWQSYAPFVNFQVISNGLAPGNTLQNTSESGLLNENANVMSARGTIFLSTGRTNLTASHELDTTLLPDGPHTIRAVAHDGSALRTQGHAVIPFTVSNHNGFCAIIWPEHGASLESGTIVTALVGATLSAGSITSVQFLVHGKLSSQTNASPWQFEWNTAARGAGLIDLQAKAWGSGGEEILSPVHTVRVFLDTDGDGIPDWWEYEHFGGITNAVADADDDGDGADNLHEYVSGTDPNDEASLFRITNIEKSITNGWVQLDFASTTSRLYNVDYRDDDLAQPGDWISIEPSLFRGLETSTTWFGTNAPAMTNFLRYFRVWVQIP